MLKELSDIAPKAMVAAAALWVGANYFLIAPEVAARIVKADYLGQCEGHYKAWAMKAAEDRLAAVPPPVPDPEKELASRQLNAMLNDPMFQQLGRLNLPRMPDLGGMLGIYEEKKRATLDAYRNTVETIKADTATELGKSGSVCGCVADIAISETHTDWTIFSATLGVIRPASLKQFDQRMETAAASGQCARKAVR